MSLRIALAVLCAAPLAAQQGAFTTFGTGCSLLGQTLSIGPGGAPPRIGATFLITYSGPNFTFNNAQQIAHPFLVFGFNTFTTPIPTTLLPMQPSGCTGFITPDATVATPPDPNRPGIWEPVVAVRIPNSPPLVGATFFSQWLTVFEQCGFAGCGFAAVATSDAARITIGV